MSAPSPAGGRDASEARRRTFVCPRWLIPAFDNPVRRLLQNPDRIVSELVPTGGTALDLGCGIGYFSVALARRVGPTGRVVCVDLQPAMLEGVRRRAERAGLLPRITLLRAAPDRLGLDGRADGALAFWMLHEVPDRAAFLAEVAAHLEPGGRLLVVEPRGHVGGADFDASVAAARAAGFLPVATPRVALSRSVLLTLVRRGHDAGHV